MKLPGLEYKLDCAKAAVEHLKDCLAGHCERCRFYGSEYWGRCEELLINEVSPELDEFFKALEG